MNLVCTIKCFRYLILLTGVQAMLLENQLVGFPKKLNKKDAINFCKSQSMNLVKIQDDATNELVLRFALKRNLGSYWIDGSDENHEGHWTYSDGSKLTYSKWSLFEPNNLLGENCIHILIYLNGLWNDINCGWNLAVICYKSLVTSKLVSTTKTKATAAATTTKSDIQTKSSLESISIFLTFERLNYNEAVEFCSSDNLELIRIDDKEVNMHVHRMVSNKKLGLFWINGMYDTAKTNWLDTKGNPLKYRNFETETMEKVENKYCIEGMFYGNETWHQASCESKNVVICMENKVLNNH